MKKTRVMLLAAALIAMLLPACQPDNAKKVVIYTSVDQVFSEPIFKKFEAQTGIKVLPVYDVEAAKTTGLVNRLITEKNHPQADVFWNGEFAQTLLLKEKGVLTPYQSPNAAGIPSQYRDAAGYWTGLGGRSKVLLVNTNLLAPADYPKSIMDLLNTKYPADKIGIAYPLFGSTATEAAALYTVLGAEKGRAFYQALHDRGVRVVDGISVIRDMVSSGQMMMGLVDTDDACEAIHNGKPVAMDFLDQDGMGELLIPNTAAMITGGPHPAQAKTLIDFLLSREAAQDLIDAGWTHVPVLPGMTPSSCLGNIKVKSMNVSLEDVYRQLQPSQQDLAKIYIK
jgi:iron(III) transport system substrate-binding protein